MRRAAVDIGTNTVRVLVADYHGGDRLVPVIRREAITRLGGGFTAAGGIAEEAMGRTLAALKSFRNVIFDRRVESVAAVATSVVRKAVNGNAFVQRAREEAGIEITVISGETEATLAMRGALLPVDVSYEQAFILDIGGGSTEFILTRGAKPMLIESIDLGVVHLTESYVRHDPPAADELHAIEQEVQAQIRSIQERFHTAGLLPFSPESGTILIGIAGTPTTLAALDLQLHTYDRDRVTNHTLPRNRIEEIFHRLIQRTARERLRLPGLQPGREDLIIPGAMITLEVMDRFGFSTLRVIDSGILEGIILARDLIEPYRKEGLISGWQRKVLKQ